MDIEPPRPIRLYRLTGPDELTEITEQSDYGKPTLISFGGNGAITKYDAIKDAQYAQAMLGRVGIYTPDLRINAVAYPGSWSDFNRLSFVHNDPQTPKGNFDPMAMEFVKRQFLPLVAKNVRIDTAGQIRGKKLPLEKIKRNFSNIRIMTHSFGSLASEQVGNALVDCMKKLGYSQQDIDDATREILVINVGGITNPSTQQAQANFTQITLLHDQDNTVRVYSTELEEKHALLENTDHMATNAKGEKVLKPLNIITDSPEKPHRVTIFADSLGVAEEAPEFPRIPKKNLLWSEEELAHKRGALAVNHLGKMFWKDGDRLRNHDRIKDPDKHSPRIYLAPKLGKNGFIVPAMAQCALINALNNSVANQDERQPFKPLPEPKRLFKVPMKAAFTQAAPQNRGVYGNPRVLATPEYGERIKAAWVKDPKTPGTHGR